MAAPEQDRTDKDGTLSLMLFYGKGRLRTLIAFPSIFKGEHVKRKKMVLHSIWIHLLSDRRRIPDGSFRLL